MKDLPKTLCLIAVLAGLAAAPAWAYKPIPCSQCDCRTACGTLCTTSGGLYSACGLNGNWCEISPVCQGSAAADETPAPADLAAFLDSLGTEPGTEREAQLGL